MAGGLLGLASFFKDGGRVTRKAAGGGLSPYDPQVQPNGGLGGGSWVAPVNLAVGHTAPAGMSGGSGAAPNAGQNMAQVAKGVQGLGNAFNNSALGDKFNDYMQDMGDNLSGGSAGLSASDMGLGFGGGAYARGGSVPHFDAGGDVTPDALWADADNPHGTGPRLQPSDVSPLAQAANLPTPEQAMAARYAQGQMPAPQQDGFTPQQRLAVAMGAPMPASGDTPPAAPAAPAGLAAPEATPDAGLAKLRTAMGGSDAAPRDPNAVFGDLGDTGGLASAAAAPLPPVRPAGLGVEPSPTLDAAVPGGLGAAVATAAPTQLAGAGLGATAASASPASEEIGGLNPNARGMKNNNPGNLESNSWTQSLPGYVGTDGRFAIFATPQDGLAAIDRNLQGYGRKGISTPLQIASTWAPGSEQGNNPSSYGAVIAKTLGVGVNDPVDMSDPATRAKIGKAIAFVENGPGKGSLPSAADAPASRAIADASPAAPAGLGAAQGYRGAPLTTDSPVASTDARPAAPDQGGGLLGFHFSDAARQGMLAAGLGMLGGTSMNPFVNIGQGGLGGLKAYNDARKLQSEIGLQGAQAARQNMETGLLPAKTASEIGLQGAQTGLLGAQTQGAQTEADIKKQQLNMMLGILGGHAAEGTQKADAIEKVTAPATARNGVPAAPPPQKQVDPRSDPFALRAEADRLSLGGPMFKDRADRMYAQAAAIMSGEQQVQFTDGTTGYYPGVSEAKAAQAKTVKGAEAEASVPAAIATKAGETNYETNNKVKTEAATNAENGQNMLSQALALRNLMFDPKTGQPLVNSGPYGDKIAGIAATLKQFGVGDGVINALTGTDPNNAQAIEKLRTALGSESARADLAGSQIRVAEFQRFLAATPNAQLLPAAYKYIIDKAIIPKAQQQIQEYETIKGLDPQKDDLRSALFNYRQEHPYYVGAPPAEPENRVKGVIYSNPQGARARWTGTGWAPVK